jgi:hypothetical protein
MSWPTPQDYNEALQHPNLGFADPELKQSNPILTPLGLPRPITGGFASVYRMRCGRKDWAVRCFLREFSDQSERYAAISRHLLKAQLPYMVGFDYQGTGLRLNGRWYPILKMDWIEGDLLNDYVQRHLNKPVALRTLAQKWLRMMRALAAANIAHGDLQSGNVLVVNHELKLIDYDGMFVPSMAGQKSHEIGHRHFQHPKREIVHFGKTLDHFASWVIYLSLTALSIDPNLWHQLNAGEESLLLHETDFKNPASSSRFQRLAAHPDQSIQRLASDLQLFLNLSPLKVPPIEEVKVSRPFFAAARIRAMRSIKQATKFPGAFKPVQVSLSYAMAEPAIAVSNGSPRLSPSWLQDLMPVKSSAVSVSFAPAGRRTQGLVITAMVLMSALALSIISYPFFAPSFLLIAIAFGLSVVAAGLVFVTYLRDPLPVQKRTLLKTVRNSNLHVSLLESRIDNLSYRKKNLERRRDRRVAILRKRASQLQEEKQRLRAYTDSLRDQLRAVFKTRRNWLIVQDSKRRDKRPMNNIAGFLERTLGRTPDKLKKRHSKSLRILQKRESAIQKAAELSWQANAAVYDLNEKLAIDLQNSLTTTPDVDSLETQMVKARSDAAVKRREIENNLEQIQNLRNITFYRYLVSAIRSLVGSMK